MYTYQASDLRYHLQGVVCNLAFHCSLENGWNTDPSLAGSQFNPKMRKSPQIFDSSGSLITDEEWKVSLYAEDGTRSNAISVREGNLAVLSAGRVFANDQMLTGDTVCPDNRGYWGDYDEVQFMRADSSTNFIPQFIVTGSDSSDGTCPAKNYNSTPIHISDILWR
jgi:hypothetical protein